MQVRCNYFSSTLPECISKLKVVEKCLKYKVYLLLPELYVVARVAEHGSEYQGTLPLSVVLDMVTV